MDTTELWFLKSMLKVNQIGKIMNEERLTKVKKTEQKKHYNKRKKIYKSE